MAPIFIKNPRSYASKRNGEKTRVLTPNVHDIVSATTLAQESTIDLRTLDAQIAKTRRVSEEELDGIIKEFKFVDTLLPPEALEPEDWRKLPRIFINTGS
jgi:hypothetical protein